MKIRPYTSEDRATFKALNIAWLEKYFYVEPYDTKVLSNPQTYIIDKGGFIFMVDTKEKTIGTMSLLFVEDGVYEFTKMAVEPAMQGNGIGKEMMVFIIAFAKAENLKKLILYSNTLLENAIHIYRKFGFREIPQEHNTVYERANIKMELTLN